MFPQLWNSFSEELIQQNRIIYINVMEDLFVKKKKWYKIINITIVESTENVYHATKQNILLIYPTIKTDIKNGG